TITGDFNGDGRTDYLRLGASGAWTFFGAANRSFARGFQTYVGLNFGSPSTWQPITGDFNGDGCTDYARLGATGAWLYYGHTDGGFTQGFQAYPGLNFGDPSTWEPITGDFNGDHRTDYARLGDTGAWLYFGNADGSFSQGFQNYDGLAFGQPSQWKTVTGDFNGDGRTDYARTGDTGAWLYYGAADGSFGRGFLNYQDIPFGSPSPWQMVAGDFDGDGKGDFARLGDKLAWIFTGNADGSFTRSSQSYGALSFGLPSNWQAVAGDFDGDKKTDYVRLGGPQSYVFYRNPNPSFTVDGPTLTTFDKVMTNSLVSVDSTDTAPPLVLGSHTVCRNLPGEPRVCTTVVDEHFSYVKFSDAIKSLYLAKTGKSLTDYGFDVPLFCKSVVVGDLCARVNQMRTDLGKATIAFGATASGVPYLSMTIPLDSNHPTLLVDTPVPNIDLTNMVLSVQLSLGVAADGTLAITGVNASFNFNSNVVNFPDWAVDWLTDVHGDIQSKVQAEIVNGLTGLDRQGAIGAALTQALADYAGLGGITVGKIISVSASGNALKVEYR
ncbi:MAG TPA: VCBS repeat-containing protein, partial [Polyangiaceae bacterium]